MMPEIWDHNLFESPEAQDDFNLLAANVSPEYAEKLRSVLGKPSQFVGRVMSWESAIAHWAAWEEWERTEGAAVAALRPEPEPERVIRPVYKNEVTEAARMEWKIAVRDAALAEKQWKEWERTEIAKIKEQSRKAIQEWNVRVAYTRDAFRKATGKI